MSGPAVIGVDIGGTKIAAGLMSESGVPVNERSLARAMRPTPRTGGADVLRVVAELVTELLTGSGGLRLAAVGVGAPGVIDVRTGRVVSATGVLPGWAGTDVEGELARLLGVPVAVDNDVRVMALGELRFGAGRGGNDILFVSVGTGIGGALVLGGAVRHGTAGVAGELAHLLVPGSGPIACGCGRTDHVEAFASGPAIEAEYARRTGVSGVVLRDLVARLDAGDESADVARAVLADAAAMLGDALAGVVNVLDVERVIVGGGVATIGEPYLAPLARALREGVLPPLRDMPVRAARLGADAPLLGAAQLAVDLLSVVPS